MRNIVFLAAAVLLLPACAIIPKKEIAAGRLSVWCNERYLPSLDAKDLVTDKLHLKVAKQGYLYALIGAYVLQKDNQETNKHYFDLPDKVSKVLYLSEHDERTGFEANTFIIHSLQGEISEIIVAFTGSNDLADWKTNFSMLNKDQYAQARAYVKKVASAYPGAKLSVTGYSLGGALARACSELSHSGKIQAPWKTANLTHPMSATTNGRSSHRT